jgi:hypothetical protein
MHFACMVLQSFEPSVGASAYCTATQTSLAIKSRKREKSSDEGTLCDAAFVRRLCPHARMNLPKTWVS